MFAIFFLNVSRKLMLLIFTIRVSRLAFLITIRSPVFIGTRVSPSKYAMPCSMPPSEVGSRYARVLKDAFISVDLAKNILVIKTVSGMAMAAAAAFDEMNWSEIVGCIGGDDTIFCVARDDDAALVAAERLKRMVDGMEETGEEF